MNLSHEIPFTRFHLPDGRRTPATMQVDADTFAAYQKVADSGLRMTVEILTTGAVSQCIEDPNLGDFDCVVCANGPYVPIKLKEMLLRFDAAKLAEWRKEMS